METIQGVRTKLLVASYSHGVVRVPLAQTFNITPRITERSINEFDRLEAALVVTTFDAVDCTFEYFDSDSKLVDAMFNDQDPSATTVVDNPANYQIVNLFANMKSLATGLIFASVLIKQCKAKGSPYTEPVKEEARVTRDVTGTEVMKIKGAAINYLRILNATPDGDIYQQAVPPNAYNDMAFSGYSGYSGYSGISGYGESGFSAYSGCIDPFGISLPETALLFGSTSGYAAYVLKNGQEVLSTDYIMTSTDFVIPREPLDTDVWEVWYLYTDTL